MRQQYSQKEDKYEEEIKVLTDKLKEVGELKELFTNDLSVFNVNFTRLFQNW